MFVSKWWLHIWVLGLQRIPIRVLANLGSHKDGIFRQSQGFLLPFVVHTWQSLSPSLSYPRSYSLHKWRHLVVFSFSCKEKYNLCQLPNYDHHTPFTLTVPIQSSYLTLVGWLSKQGTKMFLAAKCIQFRKALDNLKGLKFLRFDPWVKTETLAGKMESGLTQRKGSQVWFCFEWKTFISSSTLNKGKLLAKQ